MSHRKAVSIILTRDPDSTEIYLVERNPKLRFFGGYFAFPGGTLDAEDVNPKIKNSANFPVDSLPYLFAAVRETFEETGVLLSKGKSEIPQEKLREYRSRLLGNEINLPEILKAENQIIDAEEFNYVCTILTPEFAPVRYHTQFYWAKIPRGQSPEIWQGELVDGVFHTAEKALALWQAGDMLIVPPVIFMLKELIGNSVQSVTPYINEYAEAYRRGKIHQVYFSPGIQLISLRSRTIFPAAFTNTYLVGESQLYIVDPAPAGSKEQERLWDFLEDMISEGRQLIGILLTHHHPDHIGAVQECQRRFNLPILAHAKTVENMPNYKFSRCLEHGDELELGQTPDDQSGWKLKVYDTPGHAQGHLAFQETRYGAVIVGDMISTISSILINPPEGHMATYLRSLKLLESITTGMLYPGHGPAVRDGRKVVQHFLEHRHQREQKLLQLLNTQPRSITELIKIVYDDVNKQNWPMAERSLLAGLIKLIEEGKCQQVGEKFLASG